MLINIEKLFVIILPLLLIGVYFGLTPFILCVLLVIIRMLTSSRDTSGFYLLAYSGPLAGIIRTLYPSLPIYGVLLMIISFFLLKENWFSFLKETVKTRIYMILAILVFIFSYIFISEYTQYAYNKIINIIISGISMFYCYYVYNHSTKIESTKLMQLVMLTSIGMLAFAQQFYNIEVGGIFQYGIFRESCSAFDKLHNYETQLLTNYQNIGVYMAFALSIYYAQCKLKKHEVLLYSLIGIQCLMTCSARQGLLAFIVMIILRIYVKGQGKNILGKLTLISIFLFVAYYIISTFGGEVVSSSIEEGDEGRSIRFALAIDIWKNYPLFGVGIGGFSRIVGFANYPHNFFLEILCECGIVGLIALMCVVGIFLMSYRIPLNAVTASDSYIIVFVSAMFVRFMVSADLTSSIDLFAILFTSAKCINKN